MKRATIVLCTASVLACGAFAQEPDYDKVRIKVTKVAGSVYLLSVLAIHALAPTCSHCDCKIIGHGVEKDGKFYCCAHCASQEGVKGLKDRA